MYHFVGNKAKMANVKQETRKQSQPYFFKKRSFLTP